MLGRRTGDFRPIGIHMPEHTGMGMRLQKALDAEIDRWFLWVPVCFAIGIGTYFSLSEEPSGLTGLCLLASSISLGIVFRNRPFTCAVCIALICAALGFTNAKLRTELVKSPRLEGSGSAATLNAWVMHVESRQPKGHRLTLQLIPSGGNPPGLLHRIRITSRFSDPPATGQAITIRAVLRPIPEPVQPHGFDFSRKAYYSGLGAVGFAISKPVPFASSIDPPETIKLRSLIDSIRRGIEARISAALPEKAAAVTIALITGDRGRIPENTLQALRDSGLAHLLAISGMHMAVMAGALYWLIRAIAALNPRLALTYPVKKWAAIAALIGGLFYLAISGGAVATQRAFLMMAIIFTAILIDRPALTLRNVAISALIILAFFPESLLDVSFQMSFAAVTALIAVYERLQRQGAYTSPKSLAIRVLGLGLTYIAGIALTTLVASIAIAPIAAYHFHKIAQFSLLANLAAMPFFGLSVMPSALLALLAMPFGLEFYPLQFMAYGIENIIAVAQRVSAWEGATVPVAAMPITSLLALVFGGLWLTLWQTQWRLLGLPIALLGALTVNTQAKPDLLIGRDAEMIALRDNQNQLGATGVRKPNYSLKQWLRSDGDQTIPAAALKRSGFKCDELACVARHNETKIAIVRHPAALQEECATADIVIAQIPINRKCPNARVHIDRLDLWRWGAHALYLDGQSIRIETVAEGRGNRPWSRTVKPRKERAVDGSAYARESDANTR